ncbi:MAG TPA: AMP-binding protein, partial [Solirubrobacteraceae bacterium]
MQNVAEVARYGGLQTADVAAPYAATLLRGPHGALRHYFHDAPPDGPPIVLVVSMPMSAEVWDVSEATSAVRQLHAAGLDPWVVDFGPSGAEEGGLQRTLSDHVLAVSGAVDEVRTRTGRDVHLAGYSQGGMLCYQVAALRRSESLASVITFGAPVDMSKMAPISADAFARVGQALGFVSEHVSVPGWVFRNAFRVVDPVKSARKQAEFVLALHDREALLPREGQRRFIDGRGWVTVPGPALAEFAQQFLAHNRMLEGGFVVDGRTVSLADITCPVLAVIGDIDEIAPARAVRPLAAAAPRAEAWETHVRAGHLGLVLGSKATDQAWPAVIEWTRWIEGQTAEPPAGLQRLSDVDPDDPVAAAGAGSPAGFGPEVVLGVTAGAAHTLMAAGQSLASLGREVVGQVPILTRLQRVKPTTRTSLALTLDEQAAKDPDRIQFIYRERAFTRAEAKRRFDAVARGLIEIGVRRGDRVGVLMSARPSAFAAVAALNRIGALAVLLRPGAEMLREVELGEASRIICDPESVKQARRANRPVFVLGGGPDRPRLPRGVVDLELIDADAVRPPAWYRPNPGRAMDVAFVLFTGEGEATRVNHITNRRWTLSAYGTASAASLRPRDTVYCLAPPSHPSGLLVAMGGAIAGGARFAMTEGFDPARFWDEVRRYGVTVVVYTWTMLSELVDRSPADVERSHPIRLFVGSGMAPALWRRTLRRFAPAGVVDFYTTPNAETVLVNVGASKPGSLGRELPGSASVRVVEW